MPYNPNLHHRRSIRLKDYDYSLPGAYFITLVTWQRSWLFGIITNGEMQLNPFGHIVADRLNRLPNVNTWIVMPNHVHLIYMIEPSDDQLSDNKIDHDDHPEKVVTPTVSLPAMIQNYKSVTTRLINNQRRITGTAVWQRNYYEHIIRSFKELMRISDYIANNPRDWAEDPENIKV